MSRTKTMRNRRMAEKLEQGDAIDVSGCERTPAGEYILARFAEDTDYCDARTEEWIWSIGREHGTGRILASTDTRFYENPEYLCLFLR
jgi:hypothetical protein